MNFTLLQQIAKEKGVTEIELYEKNVISTEIEIFEHQTEKSVSYETTVMAIRGVYQEKIGIYYTEDSNEALIPEIIDRIMENTSLQTVTEPYFIYGGSDSYPEVKTVTPDFKEYTMKDKIDLCLKLESMIESRHELVERCPGVSYSETVTTITIVNSNGLNVMKKSYDAFLLGESLIKQGEEVKTGYDYQIVKRFADFNLEEIAKGAVDRSVASLGGAPISSKSYHVVLENKVATNLLEVFSSVFSAEQAIKNLSFLKGKEGEKVFGDNITIVDDPLLENAKNVYAFDDEGVASYRKTVVEKGVFKTMLHNLKTAKMYGVESTANGYKAGVSGNVNVQPTNLLLEPGTTSFDELLKECGNGVLITNVQGLHSGVNIISGDFSLQASGFLVENGVLSSPVTLIVLSGNIKEVFSQVEVLGSDIHYGFSGVAAPSLLIKSMSISGK